MTACSKTSTTSQATGSSTLPYRRTKSGLNIPLRCNVGTNRPLIPQLYCRLTLMARTEDIRSFTLTKCRSRHGSSTIPNTGSLGTRIQSSALWPVVEDMVYRRESASYRYLSMREGVRRSWLVDSNDSGVVSSWVLQILAGPFQVIYHDHRDNESQTTNSTTRAPTRFINHAMLEIPFVSSIFGNEIY